MSIYDRNYYQEEEGFSFHGFSKGFNACKWIIGICVALFVLQILFRNGVGKTERNLTDYLILEPQLILQGEVWRLISYGFIHSVSEPFHIIFNMLMLWWFGREIEECLQPIEFLSFYLVSIVFGGLIFVGCSFGGLHGRGAVCLGASGGVTAVMVLYACWFPRRTVLFMFVIPMQVWLLTIILIVVDALNLFSGSQKNIAGEVHLAGAAFGLAYYKFSWTLSSFNPFKLWKQWTGPRLKIYKPSGDTSSQVLESGTNFEFNENEKLDEILKKISVFGKESLTAQENEFLIRTSQAMRKKRT